MALATPGQDPAEKQLAGQATTQLSRLATQCDRLGARGSARAMRLEIVTVYDPDHAPTRKTLGHTRIGARWSPPVEDELPRDDLSERGRRRLEQGWQRLADDLAKRHLQLAQKLAQSGNAARSEDHLRRVLRFRPDDAEAGRALGLVELDGLWLTPVQQTVFLRRRMLQQVVARLREREFPIEALPPDMPEPWLQRTVPDLALYYSGFRGPSVEIWGDLEPAVLREAVQVAERCNLLMRALLAGSSGHDWRRDPAPVFILSTKEAHYHTVVDASSMSAEEKAFAKKYVSGEWFSDGSRRIFFSFESGELEDTLDRVARCTAGVAADSGAFVFEEGFGHAACGWLLGQTLSYFMDLAEQEVEHTVAGKKESEVLVPDIAVWRSLAVQQAWLGNEPDAARLMLYTASDMPNDARIKAWSWTYYLLLRDPSLVIDLERAHDKAGDNKRGIAEAFFKRSGIQLSELEQDWRQHWRTVESLPDPWAEGLRRGSAAEQKLAVWMEALSRWRVKRRLPPIGFVRSLPPAAVELLAAEGVPEVLTADRDPLDLDVLWEASGDLWNQLLVLPAAAWRSPRGIDGLLTVPGSRDLLLAPALPVLRYTADRVRAVLHVPELPSSGDPAAPDVWPADGAGDVPAAVAVAELGEFAMRALDLDPESKSIGYPISLHFGPCKFAIAPEVECRIEGPEGEILGSLTEPDPGLPRRLSAPGMFVFYPRSPLPVGGELVVHWRWRAKEAGRQTLRVAFRVR